MEIIITIFNESLYRPLFNALIALYNFLPGADLGVAIIVLTLLIRFILYPLTHKALRSQKQLQEIQPEIKKLQNQHKNNREEQARAMMGLYKKYNINPFSGCIPLLVQLPILLALYKVFLEVTEAESLQALYSFVPSPESINTMFLGLVDLTSSSPILAVLAGLSQFAQAKITFQQKSVLGAGAGSGSDFQKIMGKQMTYMMPLFMVFIAWNLPAGLPLYWVVTMLFSFGQQYIINKSNARPANYPKHNTRSH